MSNHNRICKDGFFANIHIKGKQVIDVNRNVKVRNLTVGNDATIRKNLTICGDLEVKGCITQLGEEYDVIIIGAGTAGAVAAKEISDAGISVLALEAGANENENVFSKYPFGADAFPKYGVINAIQATNSPLTGDIFVDSGFSGNITRAVISQTYQHGGRGWGGASNHHYLEAGHTSDAFDDKLASIWGGPNWAAAATRPLKAALETYTSFDGPSPPANMRGTSGPIQVIKSVEYDPSLTYIGNILACSIDGTVNGTDTSVSCPLILDFNASGASAASRTLQRQFFFNPADFSRSHSGNGFLGPDVVDQVTGEGVGGRPLKVVSRALVNKIHFEDVDGTPTAKGVEAIVNGKTTYYTAKHKVIVCAGSLRSPSILERSGIGGASLLNSLGIDVVYDNPAVGENYQNHVATIVIGNVTAEAANAAIDPFTGSALNPSVLQTFPAPDVASTPFGTPRYSEWFFGGGTAPPGFDTVFPNTSWLKQNGADIFNDVGILPAGAVNLQPVSRGSLHIVDTNPDTKGELLRNMFTAPEDVNFAMETLKYWKRMETCMASMDPGANFTIHFPPPEAYLDDAVLIDYARASLFVTDHSSSTCRMGLDQSGNVVGSDLHVYGVNNLMVADMSIYPIIPDFNTSFPAQLVGKQAAKFVVAELAP